MEIFLVTFLEYSVTLFDQQLLALDLVAFNDIFFINECFVAGKISKSRNRFNILILAHKFFTFTVMIQNSGIVHFSF